MRWFSTLLFLSLFLGGLVGLLTMPIAPAHAIRQAQQPTATPAADTEAVARATQLLNDSGAIAQKGDLPGAIEKSKQALEIYRQANSQEGMRNALGALGVFYGLSGQNEESLKASQQALEIAKALNDIDAETMLWNFIGRAYFNQGKFDQALAADQQALQLAKNHANRQLQAQILSNMGATYQAQARYTQSIEVLQQSLEIGQELNDLDIQANALAGIGVAYYRQGAYTKALDNYQQALQHARSAHSQATEEFVLNDIGDVYQAQGNYAQSLDYYQQALQLIGPDITRKSNILNNIGLVYLHQNLYARARDYLEQALAAARATGDRAYEAITLTNLGTLYSDQGQYSQALVFLQQALGLMRQVHNRAGEGSILGNIGSVYTAQGTYAQALDYLQQALAIHREVHDQPSEAAALNNIGGVYRERSQFDLARSYYQQALTIWHEQGDRRGEGTSLNNIGDIDRMNKHYDEALASYQQAQKLMHALGIRGGEGTVLGNIGLIYTAQKRLDQALLLYQEDLRIQREVGSRAQEAEVLNNIARIQDDLNQSSQALTTYQQALTIAQEIGAIRAAGDILARIGQFYDHHNQYDQALATYLQAINLIEPVRAVAGSEQGRSSFIAQYDLIYGRAISLAHQQGQDNLAFTLSERGRARSFLDSLATGQVQLSDEASTKLLAQERDAYAARQSAQDALSLAQTNTAIDKATLAELEQQLADSQQAYDATLAAIDQSNQQLATLIPGRSKTLDLAAVQQQLDAQTTLVSYYVLSDQTLAFVLTRTDFHTEVLPIGREALRTLVVALRQFSNTDAPFPASAVTLYNDLIAPLKPHITTPQLLIVPHSVLHYMPFAALTDGQQYLVDTYTLTTLPSASTLPYIQANSGRPLATPLILGNPATGDSELKPLLYAESEAQDIAALYGVQPLLGPAATQAAVETRARDSGIIHIAAHGIYDQENPLASTIVLAPNGTNDGRLNVGAVYKLDLHKSELVVLSACETQLGPLSAGDEVVSLTRSLIFAGTPSVIATLWPIEDNDAPRLLMKSFYTSLREGMGKAEALRQAQADVRNYRDPSGKQPYASPFYWSGFVLSGDGGPVATETPLWRWVIVGAVLLFLIGAASLLWWRRRRIRQSVS